VMVPRLNNGNSLRCVCDLESEPLYLKCISHITSKSLHLSE
jgi:hypothetical protein